MLKKPHLLQTMMKKKIVCMCRLLTCSDWCRWGYSSCAHKPLQQTSISIMLSHIYEKLTRPRCVELNKRKPLQWTFSSGRKQTVKNYYHTTNKLLFVDVYNNNNNNNFWDFRIITGRLAETHAVLHQHNCQLVWIISDYPKLCNYCKSFFR